jgi:hypothetical protein
MYTSYQEIYFQCFFHVRMYQHWNSVHYQLQERCDLTWLSKVVSLVSTVDEEKHVGTRTEYTTLKNTIPVSRLSSPPLDFPSKRRGTDIVHQKNQNREQRTQLQKTSTCSSGCKALRAILPNVTLECTLCPWISLLEKRKYFTLCFLSVGGKLRLIFRCKILPILVCNKLSIRPISSSTCV